MSNNEEKSEETIANEESVGESEEDEKKQSEIEKAKTLKLKKKIQELKKERLENYRKAGSIHKQVVEFIKPKVIVGAKYLDICNETEEKLIELGGSIGFPTNICVNDVACHYTSGTDDEKVIKEGDIVKVDIGVAVDGYLADGAFTVSFNEDERTQNLILAVETAVLKGMSEIKPGVKINTIGEITSKIIKGFNYRPIRDLAGHLIKRWIVHGGKSIPNVKMPTGGKVFEEGEVYALECFASTGSGSIHRTNNCEIFGLNTSSQSVPMRRKISKRMLGWIRSNPKTFPFSTRQIQKEFNTAKFGMQELREKDKLIEHYVLKEDTDDAYISQFEHTFMITKDGIEQLT